MANLMTAWATRDDMPDLPDGVNASDDEIQDALLAASGILYRFTGKQWPGIVHDVVRPQSVACGCTGVRSGCHHVSEFALPGSPVLGVSEVLIDGDLVPEDRYRLDDGRYLVWIGDELGGRGGWPCCQRIDLDPDQKQTFQVSYTWGGIPDRGGVRAAAVLGYELLLATKPKSGCRLPQRVQSVTRQGVSYVLLDPMNLFDKGRTGLAEVDLWVASIGIGQTRRRSAVVDPHAVAMNGRRFRRTDRNPSS